MKPWNPRNKRHIDWFYSIYKLLIKTDICENPWSLKIGKRKLFIMFIMSKIVSFLPSIVDIQRERGWIKTYAAQMLLSLRLMHKGFKMKKALLFLGCKNKLIRPTNQCIYSTVGMLTGAICVCLHLNHPWCHSSVWRDSAAALCHWKYKKTQRQKGGWWGTVTLSWLQWVAVSVPWLSRLICGLSSFCA